ncbi:hypothetical protein SASPL_152252 [Salvia splendens]|uniref:Uncharacterized protein n=1 Tax=Salvia splendens TaxID=180675 RepID=A0A8X8W2X8_SALSN|nr:hypothetical protein SASPL_152252 [Salvia splendens]
MAERRHGGRRGDARGGGRDGGHGDLPNEEAARQGSRSTTMIGATGETSRKSNPMRSIASERRAMDDPLFSDVFTSYDADEPSKNSNSNIFLMSIYDTPVYDEDLFYELPEPPKNSNNNILSMLVYDKPVYNKDILLMSESSHPSMKFDAAAEDEGVVFDDDEE